VGIIEDLIELQAKIRARGPFARAIWVVDCPTVYAAILSAANQVLHSLGDSHKTYLDIFPYSISGIPLREWWTWAEREGDIKPDLPFLRPGCRGVWVEMSNGKHVHFIYSDGLLYRYKEEPKDWKTLEPPTQWAK
jgi:hypothetical protein